MHQSLQQHRLEVIGSDAGGLASLPPAAAALVRQADLLAAPARLLPGLRQALAEEPKPPELVASDRPEQLFPQLEGALAAGRAVVLLASGDPLWFGIGRLLLGRFPPECLRFHPAPSSLQLAFARLGRPWQDAEWLSLHGRDPEPLAGRLQQRPAALAVLTDPS
ncbi:MAG: precorrin-6y C5,15-methyltransferase (decarboxylating) subunit CbiE, partial [Prochlorococcaceae cyanobacterium]